jgi:hypothetical protein
MCQQAAARITRTAPEFFALVADVLVTPDPYDAVTPRLTVRTYVVNAANESHARAILAERGFVVMHMIPLVGDMMPSFWFDCWHNLGYQPGEIGDTKLSVCESCDSHEPCGCTYCGEHDLFDCWFAHDWNR